MVCSIQAGTTDLYLFNFSKTIAKPYSSQTVVGKTSAKQCWGAGIHFSIDDVNFRRLYTIVNFLTGDIFLVLSCGLWLKVIVS